MEIRLNGKEAFIIMTTVVVESAVALAALSKLGKERKRANAAEWKAWCRGCSMILKDHQINELNKKLTKMELGS